MDADSLSIPGDSPRSFFEAYDLALASLGESYVMNDAIERKLAMVLFHTIVSRSIEEPTAAIDTKLLAAWGVERVLALYGSRPLPP